MQQVTFALSVILLNGSREVGNLPKASEETREGNRD